MILTVVNLLRSWRYPTMMEQVGNKYVCSPNSILLSILLQAVSLCENPGFSCLNTRFYMPSEWGYEYREGWFRYTISLARLPARNDIGRLRWRKLNGETLSLDDIYVGRECPRRCSLHGDCRVCIFVQ